MESDAASKQEVIAGLNADLDKVRAELTLAQTKLKDDRERFDQLQLANDQLLKEYDEVTGALAAVKLGDVTAAEAKLIQQENEVLRGIIMRQIKEQARREQAYRLAQEEMERLEIRSDTLNDKINQLAKPTLELSAAEQEMLKRPVVTVLHESTDKISAQIEMLKPSEDAPEQTAAAPAEDGAPAAPEQAEQVATADASAAQPTDAAAASDSPAPAAGTETAAAADSLGASMSPEVTALITEARDQFVRGNFAGAEQLYQKFVELQPNNVVALANLGVSQFRQGKLTAAQLALEKALAVDPNDSFTLTTLGAVMIEQNRIEDAIGYLERANTSKADDAITLNYLGVASSQIGQFGKAEQSLRRAITVNPEYAEAHFNLAVIYATAKPPSIALAKRHYEKALELGSTPDKRLASMLQGEGGS
jgi:tetratricopeptide (TPR) repeat protein